MNITENIKIKKTVSILFLVFVCIFIIGILYFCKLNKSLSVKCTNGIFKGATEEDTGVITFKGIPYAKAPIGELRWKAPVEPDLSNERIDATSYGKVCLQGPSTEHVWGQPMGEDCLTLNIWTDDLNTKGKPVMVWIHGGSYGWGGTNDPTYNGQYLVNEYKNLVVVTINYRVNLLGFIDFSHVKGGEDFPDSPYLGILDQQMALRWVQKNIEAFGGDPKNVTIFGESAGGGSVVSLLAAEGSDGLFNKAIVQSGAGLNYSQDKFDDNNQSGHLMEAAGVSDMDGLMALSEDELYNAMTIDTGVVGAENSSLVVDLNNFPMKDDNRSIIPSDVSKAIAQRAKDVDILIGTTGDEMRYWVNEMESGDDDENMEVFYDFIKGKVEGYKKKFPDEAENIDKAVLTSTAIPDSKYSDMYPDIWKYTDVASEVSFRTPTLQIVDERILSGGNGKTFVYLFNKRSTLNDWQGACHACELAYVFNNPNDKVSLAGEVNETLAKDVSSAWVAFARTGNPSTDKIKWTEYDLNNRPTMVIGDDCTMKMENDPKKELRELLKNILIF